MQGIQYATKRSILCRGAFCGPTVLQCSRCCRDTATLMKILLRCDYANVAIPVHGDVAT